MISRGNQRQTIFRVDVDRRRYLELLNRYRERYQFQLRAYVLMSNHLHLLMEAGNHPLAKIMQGLQQSYTLCFNRLASLLRRGKYVLKGRFRSAGNAGDQRYGVCRPVSGRKLSSVALNYHTC